MTPAEPLTVPADLSSEPNRTDIESGRDAGAESGCIITAPIAAVMAGACETSECVTEALFGEQLDILEHLDDWLSVSLQRDGYQGFIKTIHSSPPAALAGKQAGVRHWVCQRSTLLFSEPAIKSPVLHRIPFGSELQLHDSGIDSFSRTHSGHYVWTDHCLGFDQRYPENVLTLANSHFLGTPYRWGGRSPEGTDCSGLIQALARSQGIAIPRDSGDQEMHIPTQVSVEQLARLDLVYWPGHTGILTSPTHLLHATAFTLDCRIEPLAEVIKRAGPVRSVRRLFDISQDC